MSTQSAPTGDPASPGEPSPGPTPPEGPGERFIRRRVLLGTGAALLAGSGVSATWAYDRFLREKVQVSDVSAAESTAGAATTAVLATDGSYSSTGYTSSTTTLTLISTATGTGSEALAWYAAVVEITDATVLRAAFAQDEVGQNITEEPSVIAGRHDAVLAINGDYYGFRDNGIVIRNGVIYRDEPARDGLVFYRDGRIEVYDETSTNAEELLDDGAWNTLSFGPAVLVDGSVPTGIEGVEIDTNVGNHSIQGEQPRTAIGVIGDDHLVLLVVDGRSEGYSRGVGLTELGEILADLGCTTGYNLDGGGSSVMIFDGEIITQPSNRGERATSDILYVAG
ncbi:phosphodiester glycosidase family protein [uncultured Brachybacterium sp.]|uniref:phosphodiester glycosidase family protein n=1 Tax=uncultured Brachybacterium sp. TaxID=189680 RepID=UPI00260C8972|nr:phosphodiester glycosidase family protein [uncultured Brachybacterium sp.]